MCYLVAGWKAQSYTTIHKEKSNRRRISRRNIKNDYKLFHAKITGKQVMRLVTTMSPAKKSSSLKYLVIKNQSVYFRCPVSDGQQSCRKWRQTLPRTSTPTMQDKVCASYFQFFPSCCYINITLLIFACSLVVQRECWACRRWWMTIMTFQ